MHGFLVPLAMSERQAKESEGQSSIPRIFAPKYKQDSLLSFTHQRDPRLIAGERRKSERPVCSLSQQLIRERGLHKHHNTRTNKSLVPDKDTWQKHCIERVVTKLV